MFVPSSTGQGQGSKIALQIEILWVQAKCAVHLLHAMASRISGACATASFEHFDSEPPFRCTPRIIALVVAPGTAYGMIFEKRLPDCSNYNLIDSGDLPEGSRVRLMRLATLEIER